MGENSNIRNLMIYNYGNECWLKGKGKLTYHHIVPVRDGGKNTLDNGALLSDEMHDKFNKLEMMYPQLAEEINMYLKEYKGNYPNEVWDKIVVLLELVGKEEKKKWTKSKKYSKRVKKKKR